MEKVNVPLDSFDSSGLTTRVSGLFSAGIKVRQKRDILFYISRTPEFFLQALLPVNKDLYVTRIVDVIMDMKQSGEVPIDNYLYFDPKVPKRLRQSAVPRLVFLIVKKKYFSCCGCRMRLQPIKNFAI